MSESIVKLKTYNGEIIRPVGEVSVSIEYNSKKEQCKLLIVENGCRALLGRDLMNLLGIQLVEISNVTVEKKGNLEKGINKLLEEFDELFKNELGKYKYEKVTLEVKEGARPVFCKPRTIPFAFKSKVEAELERLEKENVIEKVGTSSWGTPVMKPNGGVRLCADYKITINKFLEDYNHPLPRVEKLFVALQGGKLFSKIDFVNAYNQLELCEETQKRLAWSTHKGIYIVKRLPFGTKPACSIFQAIIEKVLQGIKGVKNFLDDIIVTGSDDRDHLSNLREVFMRLKEAGFRLNLKKCCFFSKASELFNTCN